VLLAAMDGREPRDDDLQAATEGLLSDSARLTRALLGSTDESRTQPGHD
jgi:hypothetical protein